MATFHMISQPQSFIATPARMRSANLLPSSPNRFQRRGHSSDLLRGFSDSKSQASPSLAQQRVLARPAIIQEEAPGDDSDRVPEDDANVLTQPLKPQQISTVSANRQTMKKRRNQLGANKKVRTTLIHSKEHNKSKLLEQDQKTKKPKPKAGAQKLQQSPPTAKAATPSDPKQSRLVNGDRSKPPPPEDRLHQDQDKRRPKQRDKPQRRPQQPKPRKVPTPIDNMD